MARISLRCLLIVTLCQWLVSAEKDFQFDSGVDDDLQIMLTESQKDVESLSPLHKNTYFKELSDCPYTESKIILSLVLKSNDWDDVLDNKKTRALNKLSKFFAVPKEFIKIESVSRRDIYEMSKRSIKRGSYKGDNGNKNLGKLEFMIGCGQSYFKVGEPISMQIAQQMQDGSIDDISGLEFGWWVIWKKKITNRVQRFKREEEEGSGQIDPDEDYDYDNYDDSDTSVTEVPVETTHPHRHHHGLEQTSGEDSTIPPYIEENVTNIPSTTTTSTTTTSIFASTVQSKSTIIDVTDTPTTTLISVINEKGEGGEVTTTTSRTATSIAEVEPESHAETTIVPLVETTVPHIAETSPTIPSTTPTTTTIPTTTSTTTTTTTTPKPTTTTTMEPSTEYIEPEPTNSPPLIKNRLPKQPVTAGKPFSFIVPSETFYDSEDGTNLRLELFDKAGNTLKPTSWIQFNPENKEIYGLPLEDSVSRWQFKMLATDSKNASVSETADIVVQQHKGHRSVNHEISIQVKLNEKFRSNVDWQIRLIRGIVETLNDDSMTNIVVREIRLNQTDPRYATFVYTNETLSRDTKCPEDRLDSLVERLEPSKLTKSLLPEISVKSVSGQPIGPCQKLPAVKPKPTPHMTKNFPPVPRNQVDRVNATINQLLVFKVPYDTFYDPEDHTDLKLSLLTSNRRPLDPRNWLQFDAKNQEFFGVPKYGDFGTDEYFLVAEDHEGLTANDALLVSVTPPARRDYSILTKLTLGMSYDAFNNAHTQRRFFERIAQIFGDTTTSNIQLKAIQNLNSTGNVMVSFFNTTMHKPHQRCPSDEDIETIRNVWQHSDSSVRDRVKKTLGSEFNLLNVHVTPTMCPTPMDNLPVDVVPKKTEEKKVSSFTDDYLFTFIVPAVIILVMLLLASIIACVLHRRRLTGKMELGDEEERRSFRSKGIPVIFQDELDEKPEIGNKSPIILKDEKPPLLPPSYNSDNDVDEYVPPPAVVVGGREQRGKSPVTPSYRRPPPYVSP
ncbi:dystroglycan isoform X4 [Hermetia illucens]|uniref:dystroglycan isoform X4 n=1 Tax=Hermetia illucens TaxID=343691 RepID=UPI0018CC22A1|nr:dystroglycan isoform X4 [Hermetia illucens]